MAAKTSKTHEAPVIRLAFTRAYKSFLDQIGVCLVNTVIFIPSCVLLCVTVIGIVAVPAVFGGYMEFLVRVARGEKTEAGDFFQFGFHKFFTFLWASILCFLGVALGLLLFILPGIYLIVRWYFVFLLIVDKDAAVMEAFRKSRDMVSGRFWEVLAVLISTSIVNSINGTLWAGALLTMPFTGLVSVHYYLEFHPKTKGRLTKKRR